MRSVLVATMCLLGALVVCAQESDMSEMCANDHPAVACPKEGKEDWFKLGEGRCVKAFFAEPYLNYNDSEAACVGLGGHLVSIHNKSELHDVDCTMYRLTPGRPPYWIGLFLYFHYEDLLVYEWTDATQLDFNFWAYGQPNFWNDKEECVETNLYDWGRWNDLNCMYGRGHVCAVTI
ncbi:C-type isolectin Sp-CL4-like isoform X2 [Brachionichthys hirsutus]|uniref:C-type isolectin Sp-CL4-like isoform X2 n=1 Tax=Brachionichthys hirsutus TaxID=412623 RepID=UPI00360446C3